MSWKEYYDPRKIFIFGKFMLLINFLAFLANLQRLPFLVAIFLLVGTISCTLPFMYQHRQKSISDPVYLRRVILPSFLGLTGSVLMLSLLGQWLAESYGLTYREAMGMFFSNRGMFFLVMSNCVFVRMILREAIPQKEQKPYLALLLIPMVLVAVL